MKDKKKTKSKKGSSDGELVKKYGDKPFDLTTAVKKATTHVRNKSK